MATLATACTNLAFGLVARLGAVGTFPWQTLPEPLSALHHVLLMVYAVDGIRRLMYGGSFAPVGTDLAVLGAPAAGPCSFHIGGPSRPGV